MQEVDYVKNWISPQVLSPVELAEPNEKKISLEELLELFERKKEIFKRMLYKIGLTPAEADDVLDKKREQIFLLSEEKWPIHPKKWLDTVVKNGGITLLNEKIKHAGSLKQYGGQLEPSPSVNPEEKMILDEKLDREKEIIKKALDTLSHPKQRRAIELYFFDGKEYADIAKELEVTPENLRVLIHRAIQKMRVNLSNSKDELKED